MGTATQFVTQLTAVAHDDRMVAASVPRSSTRSLMSIVGLRVSVEAEREGLDLATHGEAAYHSVIKALRRLRHRRR